jgi:D-glycero-D-manno-heptose 1,7-bisphosphate phosphatase
MSIMQPAIILDRDGVIIENRDNYVRSLDDIVFYPQALQALARGAGSPYRIVIVTNQSAVGRGIISYHLAEEINHRVVFEIEKYGGRVDGVFICPHTPLDNCTCRKPQPGLLFQAAKALSIDLKKSILIGDALTDILAGQAAGVPSRVLVMTGRGAQQACLPEAAELEPFQIFETLENALDVLIS